MRLRAIRPAFLAIIAAVALTVPASAQNAGGQQKQHQAPIAPKPPVSDDRPNDTQLFRLAEIMGNLALSPGAVRGGNREGQVWREHMREMAASEGTTALRRAKLVESFNRGYRDYSRTYRTCTQPARSSRSSATWSRHRPSPTG